MATKTTTRLRLGTGEFIGGKMNIMKTKMRPIRLVQSQKRDVRSQFAALCYRIRDDKVQILLVTSRGTGRWIVPKGWPVDGATPAEAALREAWEEAGVKGKVVGNALGIYSYEKQDSAERLPCVVAVFPVKVSTLKRRYPEDGQRKRRWVSRKKAASLISEPELRQIIAGFDPREGAR